MKTGLLLSAARVAVGVAVGAVDVRAACTTTPDCESMGYKYCASECPSGSVACPFDSSKRFCFSPKPYSVAASTCSSQCKNAGSQSCTLGGVTYYNACGSSKCKSGEECKNGSCVSTCTYTYTAESCSAQCLNVGAKSCVRGRVTYYESCGASKCSNGKYCDNGNCKSLNDKSGWCCGGNKCNSDERQCQFEYSKSCYQICITGTPDCRDLEKSCQAVGGTLVFDHCNTTDQATFTYYNGAGYYKCQ